jgi:hypothetical protein
MQFIVPFSSSSLMVTVIPRMEFALNFFVDLVLTCYCSSHILEGFLACLHTDSLTCILVTKHECDLVGMTMHKLLPLFDILSVNLDDHTMFL